MTLRFLGQADGRRHRALRAIRTLIALGLSEADVIRLMRWRRNRPTKDQHLEGTRPHNAAERQKRLILGQWAIRALLGLGFSESEVALIAEVDHSTITRALDPYVPRVLSQQTVSKLKKGVQTAGGQRLKLLLPRLAIKVLDTCTDKGGPLDETTRTNLAAGLRVDLQDALVFASSPVALVPGVHAVLAQLGDPVQGLYLIKVPSEGSTEPDARLTHLLLVEHELEHILERFREERERLQGPRDPDLPKDGRIA